MMSIFASGGLKEEDNLGGSVTFKDCKLEMMRYKI